MWNRQQVKEQAKQIMKRNYWKMFVVALIAGILSGDYVTVIQAVQDFVPDVVLPSMFSSILSFLSMESIVGLLFSIFIGFAIRVGEPYYFIKNHYGNPALNEIFQGFKGNYLNVVKIMLIMELKIMLWLLLLVVPGIIKAYEYSMIPYLLAENPNITTDEAFSLSKQMTTGQKMNLFVLDLSFLGWYFLGDLIDTFKIENRGFLCFGIGALFVKPYDVAAFTEVYLILRDSVKKDECATDIQSD